MPGFTKLNSWFNHQDREEKSSLNYDKEVVNLPYQTTTKIGLPLLSVRTYREISVNLEIACKFSISHEGINMEEDEQRDAFIISDSKEVSRASDVKLHLILVRCPFEPV